MNYELTLRVLKENNVIISKYLVKKRKIMKIIYFQLIKL